MLKLIPEMKHLTNREEEIMGFFWEKGPMFVKDLVGLFPKPKPHYNTISTIVRGLEEKGFVGHEQFGNTYRYFAKISRGDFSKSSIRNLVKKYFNASYSSVVSMFVEEEKISAAEIRELIRQAKSRKSKNK